MPTSYYSVTTDKWSEYINEFIITGQTTLSLNGWYVGLGTGALEPTHETTALINKIYDKTTTGYVGFTASDYPTGGKKISINVPYSVLSGNIIKEIGLFDASNNLMVAASTYIDLTITPGQGVSPIYVEELVLKDVPTNVTVVYENYEYPYYDASNERIVMFGGSQPTPTPTGGDLYYVYTQTTPATTWTITHNLGKNPSVSVVDTAGSTVEQETEYIDTNTCKVIFNSAVSGKAYLN